jgi:methylated-DNA-[protein]-cysteine S-methyltransferase
MTTHTIVDSPLGPLTLVAQDGALSGLYFRSHWTKPDPTSFGERADDGFEGASVIRPCHRVVGKDGKLTGYVGGLQRKQTLLDLEGATRTAEVPPAQLF